MAINDEDFNNIMQGLDEAVAHLRGDRVEGIRVHIPAEIDTKAIRKKLHMTQAQFAKRFGFATGSVRDWEQGRCMPEPSTRVLLKIIDREPEVVMRVLAA